MPKETADTIKLCEELAAVVQKKGQALAPISSYESEDDGNYSAGYSSQGTVHKLETEDFTAEFSRVTDKSWNISYDKVSKTEMLRITFGKEAHCIAVNNLGGNIEKFSGADERYAGSERIKEEAWHVTSGELPVQMINKYLTRHSNP